MIERRTFKEGETIIREKDYGEEIYVLDAGEVEVSTESDGRKMVLGILGAGEIFGEMSVIDEKPRSATVRARQDCQVKVLHRDQFLNVLQLDQEVSVTVLRSLFNRLRRANLRSAHRATEQLQPESSTPTPDEQPETLTLEGLNPKACGAVPAAPYTIDRFPCVIGRVTSDPFAHQDLAINDSRPFQISRHHLLFERSGDGITATDIGSRLGFQVGDKRFGGHEAITSTLLQDGDTLVIGRAHSGFEYRVHLSRPDNGPG